MGKIVRQTMIEPHGGNLVDRVVGSRRADQLRSEVSGRPMIDLDNAGYQDLINISNGRYSPLEGFMTQNDLLKVTHDMTLEDGTVWPLPIVLDVSSEKADNLNLHEKVGLRDPAEELVGTIEVEEIYRYNNSEVTTGVFGTNDTDHPGVRDFFNRNNFLVGGKVHVFSEERYNEVDLLPKETRVLFEHNDWETVVGFQTRNAPHRAHEYIQKSGAELVDGLLIQPKLGEKKQGDYRDGVILGAYKSLLENYYPDDRATLSVFPSKMNYAGPREAVFDALVRKNQGCTHFIIGRDHAGVGDYYGGFEAQEIFRELTEIGIKPLFYNYSFYCEKCDSMASKKICPHEREHQIHPSGTEIRETIQSGSMPSEKIMRPEVAQYIMSTDDQFVKPAENEGVQQ